MEVVVVREIDAGEEYDFVGDGRDEDDDGGGERDFVERVGEMGGEGKQEDVVDAASETRREGGVIVL